MVGAWRCEVGAGARRRVPARLIALVLGVALGVAMSLVPLSSARAAAGESTLGPGERLEQGQALVSPSGEHVLVLQADGLLALFDSSDPAPRWTSGATADGATLLVQDDGDVAVVATDGHVVWSAGTHGSDGARLVVGDDGDVRVLDASGQVRWDAGTSVRPSILAAPAELVPGTGLSSPDGRHTLDVLAEGDVRLSGPDGTVVWSTGTVVPGSVLALESDGNLVVREPDGTRRWRTRTAGTAGAALVLADDGRLTIVDAGGQVVWDAGTTREPATLAAPGSLAAGTGLTSEDGRTRLLVTDDGALVLRHGTADMWSTPPAGPGASLVVDGAGALALTAADGTAAWSAGAPDPGSTGVALTVESDGALLRDGTGHERWRAAVPLELLAADVPATDCALVDGPVGSQDTVVTSAGIRVHACLADALDRLVADAASDGVLLGGWGWRSAEQQRALRAAHCGSTPEDAETLPASACRPPTAPQGLSRHEWGLAVDLTVDGHVLTAGSPAFAWLSAHAADYGLVNLPSEPWHWSVDGS
ncbi:D-alanyl-D-alanine carboxypeptidase family protein [Cellulomonas soli]|uniref:Bulb-type lectin domain-containing protein n=1 Tax=Cellulomonas soli TaxID=931535 RepID=A0A512PDF4_9CELL|nr:D-alanyl-D-alanine carboxypeptidase family protein [Cellulomonas soli]NYI60114.1 hypothetical protein [Cellulomonas soli]GEP69233.1 hypothetical protein CSO01_19480 [Cellulomonas soli]